MPSSSRAHAAASIRDRLKASTAQAHERLHRHPFFRPFQGNTVDPSDYRRILATLYGFHSPLEGELQDGARRLDVEQDMEGRHRVAALSADLEYLGLSRDQVERLPRMRPPSILSVGSFFGTLYVREGSTIGGSVLAKSLDNTLGSSAGRLFLQGRPWDRDLWTQLVERLQAVADQGHAEDMVASANRTFAAMEAWLDASHEV